jgi:hypothetical protein
VDDAQLNAGGREYGVNRFGESGQPVHAGDEDVFHPATPKIVEYPHQAFITADIGDVPRICLVRAGQYQVFHQIMKYWQAVGPGIMEFVVFGVP